MKKVPSRYFGHFRGFMGIFFNNHFRGFMGIFGHFEVFKGTLVILEIYAYFGYFRDLIVSFVVLRFWDILLLPQCQCHLRTFP